jgi:hypothetical protein
MRSSRLVATTTFVSAALVLTACSPSQGPSDSSGSSSLSDLGPISQRLEDIYGSTDQMNILQAQVEESIAACMKEQGFDYVPVDYSFLDTPTSDVPEPGTPDFAAQYGYGITTSAELLAAMGTADELVDPNADLVNAMSPEEQSAYYAALYGAMDTGAASEEESSPSPEAYDWGAAGCSGIAQHEVFGDGASSSIATDLEQLSSQDAEDEAVVQAQETWVSCMAGKNHVYDTPDGPYQDFGDRLSALYNESDATDGSTLEDLKKMEITTAVDDVECRDSSGLDAAQATARRTLEEAYYADHKDEIDAWLQSLEEAYTGRG